MLFRLLSQMPQRKDEIKIVPGTVDAHILPGLCRKPYPALQTVNAIEKVYQALSKLFTISATEKVYHLET